MPICGVALRSHTEQQKSTIHIQPCLKWEGTLGNRKAPERIILYKPPSVCPKPNCRCSCFMSHEDGWQCWNCMKIIYRDSLLPLISNNGIEKITEKAGLRST